MIAGEEAWRAFGVLPSHCIDHFFSLLGFILDSLITLTSRLKTSHLP
jgi:hypothetical protein